MMDFLDAFFNTPGVGGVLVIVVVTTLILCYGLTIRWISKGHEDKAEKL